MKPLIKFCAFSIFSVLSVCAHAGNFTVSSVNITMTSRQPTYAVTIKNESQQEPLSMQIDPFLWSQQNGDEVYEPSNDLLISPRIFNIQPNASQIIRIALRSRKDFKVEQTYRFFVKEIPSEKPLEEGGVRVALQMNIPIHIMPSQIDRKPLEFTYRKQANGAYTLAARNPGNVHVKAVEVKIVDTTTGMPLEQVPNVIQVLSGATKVYTIATPESKPSLGESLRIRALGEGLLIDQIVILNE